MTTESTLEAVPGQFRRWSTTIALLAVALLFASACAGTSPTASSAAPQTVPETMHGVASWYGEEFAGRTTANGEIFEPLLFTAAHRTLPFGTIVEVKNSKTGQKTRVRINDRGPFVADRMIDLSYAAAKEVGLFEAGSGEVDLTVVSLGRGDSEPPAPYAVTLAQPQPKALPPQSSRSAAAAPQPAAATPEPAVTAAAVQPQPAPVETVAPVQPAPAAAATAAAGPPPVDFPLPADVARASAAPPQPEPAADQVQVTEQRKSVETRRQVAQDGTTVKEVAVATGEPVPSAPGHSQAEALDRSASETRRPAAPRGRRFVVQVGAFSVEANAKSLVDLLVGFQMKPYVDHETTLYRVRIGPYATREEAIRTRSELESKGVSAIVIGE